MTKLTEKTLYKGTAKINEKIAALHKSGQRLQTEMHKLACSVLLHLGQNKDVRVVLAFLNAMPEMSRTNGLRAWFEKHGPIKFEQVGEGKDATERAIFVKDKATVLGAAIDKPFWKFNAKEGMPYEALDMEKFVKQTIARLEKDAKETKQDHTALIAAIRNAGMGIVPAASPAPSADPLLN